MLWILHLLFYNVKRLLLLMASLGFLSLTVKEESRVFSERRASGRHHTKGRVRHVTSAGIMLPWRWHELCAELKDEGKYVCNDLHHWRGFLVQQWSEDGFVYVLDVTVMKVIKSANLGRKVLETVNRDLSIKELLQLLARFYCDKIVTKCDSRL